MWSGYCIQKSQKIYFSIGSIFKQKSEMNSMEVPQGMMRPGVTQFWQNEARSESAIESRPSMTKHMNPPPGRLDTRVSNLGAT